MTKKQQRDEAPVEGAPADAAAMQTVETWRDAKGTADWLFAAAKMMSSWPIGRVLSEAEYDAAIGAAAHVPISGHAGLSTPTRNRKG